MKTWRRRLAIGVAIALLCLGVVVTRAFLEGRSALGKGDAAAARGESAEAIRWWRRAARWYVPGAGHVTDAYDRLRGSAEAAAKRGDVPTALEAWRAIRRSVHATRSVFTPFEDRLAEANRNIAALMAGLETDRHGTRDERERFHHGLLDRQVGPALSWSILALLGLALWVGGGFAFAAFGISKRDELVRKPALWAAAAIGSGLLLWMVGLFKA